MASYTWCHFTHIVVCTVFFMVTLASFDQTRQPLGPEMCKRHCGQFSESTFCIFLIERLACVATWAKHPPQTNGEEAVFLNFTKERVKSMSQREDLHRQSRIILTRTSGFRCIKLRKEENTKLLAVPRNGRWKTPLRAFSLLNSSITTYHNIKLSYVMALAYSATSRQVLACTYKPENVQAFSIHTNYSVMLRRKNYALAIAVDDVQQLVFLAMRRPFICVASMTPDGRYFKNITRPMLSFVLCLDTIREIVYIGGSRYIYSVKYNGYGTQKITTPHKVHGLALGGSGDMMYYSVNYKIMAIELFKRGTGRIRASSNFAVSCILYKKGYFFISYMKHGRIRVYHESNFSRLQRVIGSGKTTQVIALM